MRFPLSLLLLLGSAFSLPAQVVTLRLVPDSTQVRMGDSLEVDCWLENPQAALVAGYQAFFSFSGDSFEPLAGPGTLFGSVLTDIWAFNCPPPFGSGWASCPEAGNGVAEEGVFVIGAAASPGSYSSSPNAHLFRMPFQAKQAVGADPEPFLFDDPVLTGCIGSAYSMVADSSATALTLILESTDVEVTPNLQVTGLFQPGGTLDFEVRDEGGLPWYLFGGLQPDLVDYGSMGLLHVDINHPSFRFLGQGVIGGSGSVFQTVTIPSLAGLSGRMAYCQAATGLGAPIANRRLSNPTAFLIQ